MNAITEGRLGNTALHWAASCGQLACCELLLKHGAETDIWNKAGRSACDCAALPRAHEQGPCMPEPEDQIKGEYASNPHRKLDFPASQRL